MVQSNLHEYGYDSKVEWLAHLSIRAYGTIL
jgi:hypothetical protein